jgi:hypothetical protein
MKDKYFRINKSRGALSVNNNLNKFKFQNFNQIYKNGYYHDKVLFDLILNLINAGEIWYTIYGSVY